MYAVYLLVLQEAERKLMEEREIRDKLVESATGEVYEQVRNQDSLLSDLKSQTSQQSGTIEKLTTDLEREKVRLVLRCNITDLSPS